MTARGVAAEARKIFWMVVFCYLILVGLLLTVMGCSSQKPVPVFHQCTCTYADGLIKQFKVTDVAHLNEIVFSINDNILLVPITSCNCPTIGHQ